MSYLLFTSGFSPTTLKVMRQRWEVVDIYRHREALAHLQHCSELPLAVVIGYAVHPSTGDDPLPPEPSTTPYDLPAHEMLAQTLAIDADLPVIVSTGMTESDAIVFHIKQGAFDYVVEPPELVDGEPLDRYNQRLILAMSRAVRWRQTILENRQLRQNTKQHQTASILGHSSAIQRATLLLEKVAPTPTTVLMTGESGTGKELFARATHEASDRSDQPFLAINCGALDDTLLRSELFGHERGAFTGADTKRRGLIREAGRGTLFLDEIATVSSIFQVSLLRVLEERIARPVGSEHHYPVHCRIIAASNQNLAELVASGQFREDLFYRLNVFQIEIPPLRDRPQDIPVLAQHFVNHFKAEYGKPNVQISAAAIETMERYSWPGNVRELRNVIERALILCNETEIRHSDLGLTPLIETAASFDGQLDLRQAVEQMEARLIQEALARTGNNLAAAARLLNLKRPTLHYRLRQLGIR